MPAGRRCLARLAGMGTRGTALAIAGLVLTGCSSTPQPLTDERATELFHQIPTWEGDDTTTLAEFSELVCDNWEDGAEGWDVVRILTDGGIPGEDAGASIVYATSWKCPEHSEKARLERPGQ